MMGILAVYLWCCFYSFLMLLRYVDLYREFRRQGETGGNNPRAQVMSEKETPSNPTPKNGIIYPLSIPTEQSQPDKHHD